MQKVFLKVQISWYFKSFNYYISKYIRKKNPLNILILSKKSIQLCIPELETPQPIIPYFTKKWCLFQIVAAVHPGYQTEATGLPLRPLTRIVAVLAFMATKRGTPPCATKKQPPIASAQPQQPHNTTTSVWPLLEVTKPCDIYAQAFQAWLVTNRPI